ncbi:serine hydrolase domain-containing protein [Martelella radicis]|uniref:CubicO group peptidase (Beta-lactamase class C family) n=1 Tax=Martelella radicis TaxID=1397476 RepID=A0A7W6PAU6_9HYPH|nr:serine hydrolase domain-containing protein [Martelella radicis]MBB4122771.1 CubicO group peptidase (beta-lactamase class C family) [Martelella radicis]
MMRFFVAARRRFVRSGAAAVFVPVLVLSGQATAFDLETYLEQVRTEYDLPALAAAVVRDGETVAAAAVGTRVYGEDVPVMPDDRFHLGSNAKSMTATLAGMMVEEGSLDWSSTIGGVLGEDFPGMSESLSAATLEQLLSHSSGIPMDTEELVDLYFSADTFDYNPWDRRHRVLDAWKTHEITVPEGSPFQYSNLGYMIAGMMIEKASGEHWETLMNERIFQPLGMETAGLGAQTTFGLVDAPVSHRMDEDGNVRPLYWAPAADAPPVLGPAGMAHMSIADYAKWAVWNLGEGSRGPALVAPETLKYIHASKVITPVRENPPPGTPTTGEYAFGWGVVLFDWADHALLTHNGSNGMNLARIVLDPAEDLGVVVATNFPGRTADEATGIAMEELYKAYSDGE